MICIRLKGGLGNQLFQFAFGQALAKRWQMPVQYDLSALLAPPAREDITAREYALDIFAHMEEAITLSAADLKGYQIISEPEQFRYHAFAGYRDRLRTTPLYFNGYWQHPRYLEEAGDALLSRLRLSPAVTDPDVLELIREMQREPSVAVHFRRGDYVRVASIRQRHGLCGLDYFQRAREIVYQHLGDVRYYLFSEDEEWLHDEFAGASDSVIVPSALSGPKSAGHFALMRACRYFIISNSTFSWWTAWLSEADQQTRSLVIAPKQWMADGNTESSELFPSHWLRA